MNKFFPLIVLFIMCLANNAFSQLFVNGNNINDSAKFKIIELDAVDNLVRINGGWDKLKWYRINYGQAEEHENSQLTDANGKRLPLKNIIAVANQIINQGWVLLQVNYYTHSHDNIPSYKYTFIRK